MCVHEKNLYSIVICMIFVLVTLEDFSKTCTFECVYVCVITVHSSKRTIKAFAANVTHIPIHTNTLHIYIRY